MSLDLRRIRSFHAVADHGGFRAAADALGLSQPTLSAHIAELEAELRVPLLSRTTRRVRLTRMGERFLARTRRALEELQTAALELRDEAALARGRVILACTPTLAAHAVPPALHAFRQKFPAIAITVIDDSSDMVERRVAEGAADIGVAPRPERAADLGYHSLARDEFVAVVPAKALDTAGHTIPLTAIAGEPMISLLPGTSMRRTVEQAFARVELPYEPAFEVRDYATALGLAEAGLGVAILPKSAVARPHDRGTRVYGITEPEISRDIGILLRRGEVLAPAAAELTKMLKRSLAKHNQRFG
jgi:DNA-binding transcriptional LysR family regulator